MARKTLIWDLDGTLVNSLFDLQDALNHALAAQGLPQRSLDDVRRFIGNGLRRLVERAMPDGAPEAQVDAVFAAFNDYYVVHCMDKTSPYDGILEALRRLKAAGFRMAIVSNKQQYGVDMLQQAYFSDTVEVAVGEHQGVRRKPEPDMVAEALGRMRLDASSAIYVGDTDVDVLTAQNSGMPCVSVLWGFRSREFLEAHGATRFITSPLELLTLEID